MSQRFLIPIAIAVVILLFGGWGMSRYNHLIVQRTAVHARFADVQAQYQRRFDLIPNLVNTVKGSAKFEQSTLEAVVAARSAWAQALQTGNTSGQIQAAQSLDGALSRLLVTVEAYPELKTTQAYQDLLTSIEGTENRIAVARRDYNAAVQTYDAELQQVPTNFVARLGGLQAEPFFQADAGATTAPKVDFTTGS
jgi:LemA protein